ncbi:MAG TPA: hypothetical protein VLN47_05070 [Clostridiaceae bacterium]|nr:hypothetical protein [Clostridiaceae bacterium]
MDLFPIINAPPIINSLVISLSTIRGAYQKTGEVYSPGLLRHESQEEVDSGREEKSLWQATAGISKDTEMKEEEGFGSVKRVEEGSMQERKSEDRETIESEEDVLV